MNMLRSIGLTPYEKACLVADGIIAYPRSRDLTDFDVSTMKRRYRPTDSFNTKPKDLTRFHSKGLDRPAASPPSPL